MIPQKFYKYKAFSNDQKLYVLDETTGIIKFADNGLDALSQGKIWFSHLDKLNDPYEDEYDYDDSMFFNNLDAYMSTFPCSPMPLEVKSFIDGKKRNSWSDQAIIQSLERHRPSGTLKQDIKTIKDKIKEDKKNVAGILSLCEDQDNLLMWAYYAKEHYGYCLEFSSEESHKNNPNILSNRKYTFPVTYDNRHYTMWDINPFYSSENEDYEQDNEDCLKCSEKVYCHKSKAWGQEHEWRVICNITKEKIKSDASGALLPFPGKLTAVYFGARMSDIGISAIKAAIRQGGYGYTPMFKRAQLKTDQFGLDFV